MEITTAKKKLMTLLLRNFATTTTSEFLISKTTCKTSCRKAICIDLRKSLDNIVLHLC